MTRRARRGAMPADHPDLFGLRVGSLFSGYGGLDLGVRAVLGGDVVWHSDIKPAACRLLEQRWPGAPNLGDLTAIDFREVTPVDVLTFGWPCQPHSSAGKRLGADDPRALWPVVARAAERCRPVVLVGENVSRVATNGELRRVVRSLAAIGYVGAWRCVPASDLVGAPHKRDRLLLVAVDSRADPDRLARLAAAVAPDATGVGRQQGRAGAAGQQWRPDAVVGGGDAGALLPTPAAVDGARGSTDQHRAERGGGVTLPEAAALLPTTTARDHKGTGEGWAEKPGRPLSETVHRLLPTPTENMTTGAGTSGRDGGLNLQTAAALLPTPTRQDAESTRCATANRRAAKPTTSTTGWTLSDVAHAARWGEYAGAIARWETILGRPAPDPTQPSATTGRPQLAPRFVEWMQGVPEGHVTGCVDLSLTEKRKTTTPAGERNAMLSLLGDGVVVPWVSAQVRHLLPLVLDAVLADAA